MTNEGWTHPDAGGKQAIGEIRSFGHQVDLWVKGELSGVGDAAHFRGQCCPDFSCCYGDLLASRDDRVLFAESWINASPVADDMLLVFLNRLVVHTGGAPVKTNRW